MKKILLCFILLIYPQALNSHVSHYKNIKKIEMEIFKDGKNIGYCNYEFSKNNDTIEIFNETNFEVKLLGIKVFSIISKGTEVYKNNKLFSFNSNTLQNDKNTDTLILKEWIHDKSEKIKKGKLKTIVNHKDILLLT